MTEPVTTATASPTATEEGQTPEEILLQGVYWETFGPGVADHSCGDGEPEFFITREYGYYNDPNPGSLDGNLGMKFLITGCDYPMDEEVEVEFVQPDGFTVEVPLITTAGVSGWGGMWQVLWWSFPDEPLGVYQVAARSPSGVFSDSFAITAPDAPLLTVSCQGEMVFTGFNPGEELLIARYNCPQCDQNENLIDFWEVMVDADGYLVDELGTTLEEDQLVVAIGEERPLTFPGLNTTESMSVSAADVFACGPS